MAEGGLRSAAVTVCQLVNESSRFVSNPLPRKKNKKEKIRTTIWEVGRRYHIAKMFQKTQANTETHQCVHTHTHRDMQRPQADKTSKHSLLLNFFSNYPNTRGRWETSSRESVRDRATEFYGESQLLTHYTTSSNPPVRNLGHSLSICKAGVSILTFHKS